MAANIHAQIDGLKQIVQRVKPWHLSKSGAVIRESEGRHLLDMVRDALETLQEIDRREIDI
jgi:cell division septum initiation protein DivIVA